MNDRMKVSIDVGLAGTFFWDIEHNLVVTDENIRQCFSLPERALHDGVTIRHVIPAIFEEDRTRVLHSLTAALARASHYREEFRICLEDGSIHWVSARSTVKRNTAGKATMLSGLIMDITERKMVEDALRESQAKLALEVQTMRNLLKFGTRLLATSDLRAALQEVLHSAVQLLGADFGSFQLYNKDEKKLELNVQYGFDEEVRKTFHSANDYHNAVCGRAIRTGFRVIIEDVMVDKLFAPYRRSALEAGFHAVQSTPLYDRNGNLLGVLSTHFRKPHRPSEAELLKLDLYARQAIDFIDRVRTEEALARSEKHYSAIVNQSVAGIVEVDFSGGILFSNDQFARMLGYSPGQQLLPLNIIDLVHPDDLRDNSERFEYLASTGKPYDIEIRFRCKSGSFIWVNNQISPIFDASGKPQSAVIISVDITKQKAAERLKDEFIGVASHELKTPLTGIKAYAQLINDRLGRSSPATISKLVAKLNNQVDRMVNLVYTLLDTSLDAGGELALQMETFNLNKLIEERIEEVHSSAPDHHISFTPGDLPDIVADRNRMGQVMANLLTNAIKYSPAEGGEIKVTSEHAESTVKVSIEDNGIGISEANLTRIFERFFRVDSASTNPLMGFGLGLYIAAKIIKRHGGNINVQSALGKGSIFYFTLPC